MVEKIEKLSIIIGKWFFLLIFIFISMLPDKNLYNESTGISALGYLLGLMMLFALVFDYL